MAEIRIRWEAMKDPTCEGALKCFFSINDLDIKVYKVLLDNGPETALQVAKVISRDRSTAYRSLTALESCGLVEKDVMNRGGGGIVHIYRPRPLEEVQERLMISLEDSYERMRAAVDRIKEELSER